MTSIGPLPSTTPSPADAAHGAPRPGSPNAKLMKAAQDLESVFYGQLFQAMRESVPDDGMIDESSGEKMFTGMLDDEVAKLATNQTGRDLATVLYKQLAQKITPPSDAPPASNASTPSTPSTSRP